MARCVALVLATVGGAGAEATRPPNIVVILADDMGFSDLGCYGGEIATPTLDRLAASGLRFTQFYNTARCCPTRASLLTGLYPHQAGVGHMMEDRGKDAYRGDLHRHTPTIAEALRTAGYRNYAAGKWHVTRHIGPKGPKHNWPLARGFDRFYGTIHGGGSFYDPFTLTRDNRQISPYADSEYQPQVYYYTDAISDQAARFITEHQRTHASRPFFLYVAYTAAHWPMHALEADVARYRGRYDAGYAAIRSARLEKARRQGLIDRAWPIAPQAENWADVPDKVWEARGMEVYAAMVESMDRGIGRVVEALAQTGQLQNTLVLFLQDNGGCAETTGRGPTNDRPELPRAQRPTSPPLDPETLCPAMIPPQTRDGWPVLVGRKVLPGPPDTFIAYGRGWANVSNTPFREYKHWVHEGGISTPLIVHWPAGIAAKGELRTQPGHVIDVMATCLDVAKVKEVPKLGDRSPLPPEGKSLVPAFRDDPIERDALYWEHEGNRAIRVGRWKLVAKGPAGKWELYDLEADRTELSDLAASQPERVTKLKAQWEAWARRSGVLPWIWAPAYGTAVPTVRPPGVVIHHRPAAQRQYIGSPSIAVLPNGEYVASHDLFGPGSTRDRTRVYASSDKGKRWCHRANVAGQWWSTLFFHRQALYLMGTSREYGHVVIRRSVDGGRTWTTPQDKRTGLLLADGKYHCAPVPVVEHDGRLWRAMEDAMGPGGWGSHFRSFMMSAPVEADLLDADQWTCSNRLGRDPAWLEGQFGGWLEGNAVVAPDNTIVNLLRVDYRSGDERAALVRVSPDGRRQTFDPQSDFIPFPGGCKKFSIRFDPVSKAYWSLSNYVPDKWRNANPERMRNTLALVRSVDLRHWEVRRVILQHPDNVKHGFQYADWLFEGDDLIVLSRTAHDDGLGGARNQHDANFLTFHRVQAFRD